MAQFSDTTNKSGLIQLFEFWTRQPDGTVTGTALKQATTLINTAFERLMPMLLSYNDQIRWDDLNNTDAPIGYVNILSGQSDYKITTDANSYDILNITKVRVYTSATATAYTELTRMLMDDPLVANVMSPSSSEVGIPTHFLENNNTVFLWPQPNYSAANGLELFFGRQQQYFVSIDTTKEPGIPLPFHELLALYAALDWNMVNRTDDTNLIANLNARIARREQELDDFVTLRNPSKARITASSDSNK